MDEIPEDDKNEECRNDDEESDSEAKKLKHEDAPCSPRPKIPRRSSDDSATSHPAASTSAVVGEENIDSGICIDKSEMEDRHDENAEAAPPSNSFVEVTPSTSAITAVILNLKRAISNRNYRRHCRHLNLADSDDSMSGDDSDDMSLEETPLETEGASSAESRPIVEEHLGAVTPSADGDTSDPQASSDDNSSQNSRVTTDSGGDILLSHPSYSDSESEDQWTDPDTAHEGDNEEYQTPSALLKPKPKHGWFIARELMNRELGLTLHPGLAGKADAVFEQRYYGSLHAVYRFELMYKLERHKGCVNAVNFHPEGKLLASGSDDLSVVVWDWATNTPVQIMKTGHKSNVFQSRFLYLNAQSQLNIVTCARDGQVRLLQCPPSGGGAPVRRRLMTHARSAHKLHVSAAEPHVVLSCGEDGLVQQADVRSDQPTKLFTVRDKGSMVPLYSIHGHPLEPREICVAGRSSHIRVYDRRKTTKPLNTYCPTYFTEAQENGQKKRNLRLLNLYVTCAVYNHNGSEILASYNDDDIYLFDTAADYYDKDVKKEGYTHRYSGHRNNATFKGVAFFGPRSEFVVSGSDCSYIYMWERNSEAIAQWMLGDEGGVVNCIESHPRCPVMASSGLDKDVKIWVPSNEKDPLYSGLKEVVTSNAKSQFRSPMFDGFLPTLYRAFNQNTEFSEGDDNPRSFNGNIDFDGQVCTTF